MTTCHGSPCVYEVPIEDAPRRFALKIRMYLMDRTPDKETRRRLIHAAHLLETGKTFEEFNQFGPMTMAQMKYRYVVHTVEQEETFRAAARVLDIDPATCCRIFNNGTKVPGTP